MIFLGIAIGVLVGVLYVELVHRVEPAPPRPHE